MKHIFFTLLLFCVIGLCSCRKNKYEPDIKTYDQEQIQNYITANGLTGMQRDVSGGDTTGIYYKILTPGTGAQIDYPDVISLVFTMRSLDGQFSTSDTIYNHTYDYAGHLTQHSYLTKGLMLSLINDLKNKGGRMRVLVPSHLAYGINGAGTGSSSGNNRVGGNQSLDYYVHLIDDQVKYDSVSIKNYMTANNLTGYIPVTVTYSPSGYDKDKRQYTMYYKITQAGTGSTISPSATVEIQYTGILLNGALTSDQYNTADGTGLSVDLNDYDEPGLVQALQYGSVGCKMSVILPSGLAYGPSGTTDGSIPANSCMRYDINILSVQ